MAAAKPLQAEHGKGRHIKIIQSGLPELSYFCEKRADMMKRRFLASGALMALIATVFGALGAHAFKPVLTAEQLENFKTATQYQFYHALALIAVGIIYAHWQDKFILWSGYLFLAGILIFSGSIYILSTKDISHIDAPFIGPLTPLGGLCFMAGWISFIISLFRMNNE